MNAAFSAEGRRALGGAWALLAAAIVAAAGLAFAGHWYLEQDKRERLSSGQRLAQARSALDEARREQSSQRESSDIFRALVERGVLQNERRLEMVELIGQLRVKHQLFALDYEIAPQRPLTLTGGRVFPAVDVRSSRISMKLKALHEGDVLGFVDDMGGSRQGFLPLDRCALRRIEAPSPDALAPRVEAECSFEWITLKAKNAA